MILSAIPRSVFLLASVLLGLLISSPASSDTITIGRVAGPEAIPFNGAITIDTGATGEFIGEYINMTGRTILDLHFRLNPGDRFISFMSDFFSESTRNRAGTELDAFAGTSPGIADLQDFRLVAAGLALENTSITITPTFTGRPAPEPTSLALLATGLFVLRQLMCVSSIKRWIVPTLVVPGTQSPASTAV